MTLTLTAEAKPAGPGELTRLLRIAGDGNREAFDQLFGMVYEELRVIACRQVRGEREGAALHPTELVNELYLKLVGQVHVDFDNRALFFGIAARAMRRGVALSWRAGDAPSRVRRGAPGDLADPRAAWVVAPAQGRPRRGRVGLRAGDRDQSLGAW